MTAPSAELGLRAFQSVDFNWAIRLQDVWRDPAGDVPSLHPNARLELLNEVDRLQRQADGMSPLGRFVVGEAGSGKTHLLGIIRREVAKKGLGFILVDMTDVRDFWETVAQGYLNSLQAPYLDGKPQYAFLLAKLIERIPKKYAVDEALQILARLNADQLNRNINNALTRLRKAYPAQAQAHQDTIRALLFLNSADFGIANAGMAWLQSVEMDEELRRQFQFQKPRQEPREIVRALSWIVSLAGASVLAFDQLDPIVHQVGRQNVPDDAEQQNASRLIIDKIGNGLAALRETTTSTLVVISCLETSYDLLIREVLRSNLDRFHPPIRLQYHPGIAFHQGLIAARLSAYYRQQNFGPPYPTWPFTPQAIGELQGQSPRKLFQLCEAHRRRCVSLGIVEELRTFTGEASTVPSPVADHLQRLDRDFQRERTSADLVALRDEKNEDDQLAPLYQTALQCLIHEREQEIPGDVGAFVDMEFDGGRTTKPLHARLRLLFQSEGDREEHYCVRVLLKSHHNAYKARLKAAITQAGIDKRLKFRRLTVIRDDAPPGGIQTQNLTKQFRDLGGRFHRPTDDELRTLFALARLAESNDPAWRAWLALNQPVTQMQLGHVLAPGSLFDIKATAPASLPCAGENGERPLSPAPAVASSPAPTAVPVVNHKPRISTPAPTATCSVLLGQRLIGDEPRQPVNLPIELLEKHTFVVAGAGSGKTVLLKHLVEEAALAGIPSIVIDGANDLATLGECRDPAAALSEADRTRADRYFDGTEVVVWTPGAEKGNALQLNPLPDFSAVSGDSEALEESVMVAVDGLTDLVVSGNAASREKKIAILRAILRYFAKDGGGTLESFIALLRDPPQETLLGMDRGEKMARDMADNLTAGRENNPLLRSAGAPLDPAALFGDAGAGGKTRVSVINLAGLGGQANQQQFLNQLGMTLFDWAKKNPHPPNRPIRGLFILDEAKDYVPARMSSTCKRSLMRCAAQLRKYHIGMIFATQNPKDLENTIGGNCSTHFYGKVNSPAAIEAVKELLAQKGGTSHDLGNLGQGIFYVHNADADCKTPTKIKVPLCLSNHRPNPPSPDEVIALAQRQRPGAN
jgi:hypothetical protein